jgi:hypothetical protein
MVIVKAVVVVVVVAAVLVAQRSSLSFVVIVFVSNALAAGSYNSVVYNIFPDFQFNFFFGHLHHPLRLPQTRAETARKPSDFQSHRNTASMNIIAMIIIMMCSSVVVCYNYRYLLQQLLWICRKSSRSIPAKTIEHLRQVPQKQRTRLDNTHRQTHESSHTCTRAFCVWTRAHHDHATSRR